MDLISDSYQTLNRSLHDASPTYGASSARHVGAIRALLQRLGEVSVLDYGCGKGGLKRALERPIAEYDPAVPEHAAEPVAADLVVCSDVLEHVEPECLDAVLDHLQELTLRVGYFVIATRMAKKQLADGRNAHLIVEPGKWWMQKLEQRWTVRQIIDDGRELIVEVMPCR